MWYYVMYYTQMYRTHVAPLFCIYYPVDVIVYNVLYPGIQNTIDTSLYLLSSRYYIMYYTQVYRTHVYIYLCIYYPVDVIYYIICFTQVYRFHVAPLFVSTIQ